MIIVQFVLIYLIIGVAVALIGTISHKELDEDIHKRMSKYLEYRALDSKSQGVIIGLMRTMAQLIMVLVWPVILLAPTGRKKPNEKKTTDEET